MVTAWANKGEVNHIVGDVHYVAVGLPGSRTIITVLDLNRLGDLVGLRGALYRLLYFTIPLRRCAVVTAISQTTRERIEEEFPFTIGKIVVIPCPIPQGCHSRPRVFNQDCPRILQVGTAPHKNVARLVQAIRGLPCKLHVIGPIRNDLQQVLESSGVDYQNSVNISDPEMIEAYDQADLVVFISLAEGFGMPIIEAQAIGRAVIVSNLSPMREVAGPGALMVDPLDTVAIRRAICLVAEDAKTREGMIAAGLENVRQFNAKAVALQYAQLYSSCLLYTSDAADE